MCLHGMGGEHMYFMFNELYPTTIIYRSHQTLMSSMTLQSQKSQLYIIL
jgi:hypothetical protein